MDVGFSPPQAICFAEDLRRTEHVQATGPVGLPRIRTHSASRAGNASSLPSAPLVIVSDEV